MGNPENCITSGLEVVKNQYTYKSCIRHNAWCRVVFFGDSPRSIIILTLWRSWWPRWKELAGLDTEDATWRCSAGVECCIKNGSSQMLGVLPSQTQGLKCCTNKNKDCTNRNEIVVHPGGPNCHFARCPSPWAFGLLRTPQWSLAA